MEIVELDPDGNGIGVLEGRRLAIAGTIPGELVEVQVPEAGRSGRPAELATVLRPSPFRVVPRCRHASVCGGCAWQHVAYAEQLRWKQQRLQRLLDEALGKRAPRVDPTVGMRASGGGGATPPGSDSSAPWNFRHKVSFVFGPGLRGRSLVMGHYRRDSKTVVPVEECPVHAEAGNALAFRIRDALAAAGVPGASSDGHRGVARHLVVRVARNRPEVVATLVVTANDKSLRALVRRIVEGAHPPDGLHLNINERPGPFLFGKTTRKLHGRDRLREEVGGISFLVSPTAFFQTNVAAAEILVGIVAGAIPGRPPARVLDLYAGAGLFALALARKGHRVMAVEDAADAVEDGLASQRLNQISRQACRFVRGRVEDVIESKPGGALGGWNPDVVVLDPPRAGCPSRVLRAIAGRARPSRIVYVSCNPEALARDLALLVTGGYRIDRVQPVDMFPHTAHIESVAILSR